VAVAVAVNVCVSVAVSVVRTVHRVAIQPPGSIIDQTGDVNHRPLFVTVRARARVCVCVSFESHSLVLSMNKHSLFLSCCLVRSPIESINQSIESIEERAS